MTLMEIPKICWQLTMRYLSLGDILSFVKCAKWVKGLLDSPIIWRVMYLDDLYSTNWLNNYVEKYTEEIYTKEYEIDDHDIYWIWRNLGKDEKIKRTFVINYMNVENALDISEFTYDTNIFSIENIYISTLILKYSCDNSACNLLLETILKTKWKFGKIYFNIRTSIYEDVVEFMRGIQGRVNKIIMETCNTFGVNKWFQKINNECYLDKLIVIDDNIDIDSVSNISKVYAMNFEVYKPEIPDAIKEIGIGSLEPSFESKLLYSGFEYEGVKSNRYFIYKRQ
jgi:hypothetical protein